MATTQLELKKEMLELAFSAMAARMEADGVSADIVIYGGAALVLQNLRDSTGDVDFMHPKGDDFIKYIAWDIGEVFGLPVEWMSDGVQVFRGDHEDWAGVLEFTGPGGKGTLRVHCATPEYLLAMKSRAFRMNEAGNDLTDIQRLCRETGVRDMPTLEALTKRFYPNDRDVFAPNVRWRLELVMEALPRALEPS